MAEETDLLQFKKELESLGIEENCMEGILEIHNNNPELAPYECKRKYNIIKNEEMFKKLEIIELKPVVKKSPVKQKLKRAPKPKLTPKKSARIATLPSINYLEKEDSPNPRNSSSRNPSSRNRSSRSHSSNSHSSSSRSSLVYSSDEQGSDSLPKLSERPKSERNSTRISKLDCVDYKEIME